MDFENIYLKLPILLQYLLLNLKGYLIRKKRYNKQFYKYLKLYEKNLGLELKTPSDEFYNFIKYANNSHFWNKIFKKYDFNINAENLFKELEKLPILNKNIVKDNYNDIQLNINGDQVEYTHTSGTTGSGLVFPQTRTMENKQWAIWWRYRRMHGISLNDWCGWFGGRSIVPIKQKKPPYWRTCYPLKQVMFSAHHLNNSTVKDYFYEMKNRKLKWLHGYPSQLANLANLIKDADLGNLPNLKIITLGAENLLEHQKKIIQEVFKVPVRQHYGLAEGVANISEWPDGSLRLDKDFSYVEFISIENDESNNYRIIGTNFNNYAFPLIRYDTGDVAKIEKLNNGTFKILTIDGRQEDYIILPNGVKLGRLDHIFKDILNVNEAQLYQKDRSKVIIRIVKGKNFHTKEDGNKIIKEARKRLGDDIKLELAYYNSIPKTSSGKLRFVISDH
ncbi:MAG: hypothetical protein ACOC1K_06010 [Nanoarchaeota archaeon]